MKKAEFLFKIEEITETKGLDGTEDLQQIEGWNSLTALTFIALVDKHFQLNLSGDSIARCKTVDDLIALVGDRVTS
jgi:acyl carrier protein